MPTYILTDLDGTLLRSDGSLSVYTERVVTGLLDAGHIVSFATARSFLSSFKVAGAIPWRDPVVLYNGALLLAPVTKQAVGGAFLDPGLAPVIERGRNAGLVPFLFLLDAQGREHVLHEELSREGDLAFYASRPNDPRFRRVTRLHVPDAHAVLIVTYIGLLEQLQPLYEMFVPLGSDAHVHLMPDNYIPRHYFLEISHSAANKKAALGRWTELVGCKPEDAAVFGDNLNDIGMFEAAGRRFAVANAQEALKRLADQVIGSNDDDGVAVYLQELDAERDIIA